MTTERNAEILSAGTKAAEEQMEKHPARPDYPRDFSRLYDWLEDKVYNLYEAIQKKNMLHIRTVAADLIVTASEMVEFAGKRLERERLKKPMWRGDWHEVPCS